MKTKTKNIRKRFKIKSTTDNLAKARDIIKTAALEVGFKEEEAGKIILASDEAITNVIKHAYHYSKEGEILVTVSYSKNKFTISISDKGKHFNPKKIKDPDLQKYYKEKRVGGLGIYLMKKLMDEVQYSNRNNRNKVTLVKYLR